MNRHWRQAFDLWAKTREHQSKVEKTRKEIQDLVVSARCYVAFSGGKDSTVLLHLALQADPYIPVFHWDYGIFMPQIIEAEIKENIIRLGATNVYVAERKSKNAQCHVGYRAFFGTIKGFMQRSNLDVALLGLRSEESSRRKCRIHQAPVGEASPLADWTWKDVWAYIVSRDLPYPAIYDMYAELLGYEGARLVTFFDMEFEKLGGPCVDGFLRPDLRHGARILLTD